MPDVRKMTQRETVSLLPSIKVYSGDATLNNGSTAPWNVQRHVSGVYEWFIVIPQEFHASVIACIEYLTTRKYKPMMVTTDTDIIIALPVRKG